MAAIVCVVLAAAAPASAQSNVTHDPVKIVRAPAGRVAGGASTSSGLFALPFTPTGYNLCGGVLVNGLVIGVSPCGGGAGALNPASYIASTFELSSSGS